MNPGFICLSRIYPGFQGWGVIGAYMYSLNQSVNVITPDVNSYFRRIVVILAPVHAVHPVQTDGQQMKDKQTDGRQSDRRKTDNSQTKHR
jgi:hypothetical protein